MKTAKSPIRFLILAIILVLGVAAGAAVVLSPVTINSGGGKSSGGPYSLTATIGEAAVIGSATGGSYSASYGFLPGLPAAQQPVPARQGWVVE